MIKFFYDLIIEYRLGIMRDQNTRRGLLESLTKKELHILSEKNGIPQKKNQTKTGLGSVIMSALTKNQIIKEVSLIKQKEKSDSI